MNKTLSKIYNHLQFFFKILSKYGTVNGFSIYYKCRFGNPETLKVKGVLHPIHLRRNTSDVPTFYQVFLDDEYKFEPDSKSKIIIDAGANIGLFAILMKNKYPDATIICLEPDPENFKTLFKNVENYENIHCINAGLWKTNTLLKVYDKFDHGKWGMVVEEDVEHGIIKALTISDIISQFDIEKIDILKIDIETSEREVFTKNFENWLPSVEMLIIEPHDWIEIGCSQAILDAVKKCFINYKLIIVGENLVITPQYNHIANN